MATKNKISSGAADVLQKIYDNREKDTISYIIHTLTTNAQLYDDFNLKSIFVERDYFNQKTPGGLDAFEDDLLIRLIRL
jgi:hypothetical protein